MKDDAEINTIKTICLKNFLAIKEVFISLAVEGNHFPFITNASFMNFCMTTELLDENLRI